MDYACVVWNAYQSGDIRAMDQVQRCVRQLSEGLSMNDGTSPVFSTDCFKIIIKYIYYFTITVGKRAIKSLQLHKRIFNFLGLVAILSTKPFSKHLLQAFTALVASFLHLVYATKSESAHTVHEADHTR